MMMVTATAVAILVGPAAHAADAAAVEARFYGSWLVIKSITDGRAVTDVAEMAGYQYSRDDLASWGRRSESSLTHQPPPRVSARARPMRLDILTEPSPRQPGGPPQVWMRPCIFKFEGRNLVIARGPWETERPLKPGEDYAGRPKDFTSTKANGVTVETLKPCGWLDQD